MSDVPHTGPERRQHERVAQRIPFYCYIDGQRFDAEVLDISQGGAFLRTDDTIRLKVPVLMLPKGAKSNKPPILVVGHVVRQQGGADGGVGIEWQKVISRGGLKNIAKMTRLVRPMFPESLPKPSPEFLEAPLVGYSFKENAFFIPALPADDRAGKGKGRDTSRARQALADAVRERTGELPVVAADGPCREEEVSGAPAADGSLPAGTSYASAGIAGEATEVFPTRGGAVRPANQPPPSPEASVNVVSPPDYRRDRNRGPISTLLGYERAQIPVSIEVKASIGKKRWRGTVTMLGLGNCFVALEDFGTGDLDKDARMKVELPVDLHHVEARVQLHCDVLVLGHEPRSCTEGAALLIRSVEQDRTPGLFERYIKFLYYRMIKEA